MTNLHEIIIDATNHQTCFLGKNLQIYIINDLYTM